MSWLFANPLVGRHLSFRTALDPATCAERLGLQLRPGPRSPGRGDLIGWVAPYGFSLYRLGPVKNPFSSCAFGAFEPEGTGTRVDIVLGLPASVAVFYLGMVALAPFLSLESPRAFTAALMLDTVFLLLLQVGRAFARRSEQALIGRITASIEAR